MTQKETEFRSDLWKGFITYRKKIVHTIIKKNLFIGKTKTEIHQLMGKEDNYYDLDEWAYPVKKNIFGGQTFLLIDFKGERVKGQRLYTVYNFGSEAILTL